jgi:hypothetical protein
MTSTDTTLTQLTSASLKLVSSVEYDGLSALEVFDVLGDPTQITDWYPLAKSVVLGSGQGSEQQFDVEFTFFGLVSEQVLYWDPPNRYIYQAVGPDFPIKDYIADIVVEESGFQRGTLKWSVYFDVIEGPEFQRLLPIILPAINKAGMANLSAMLGNGSYSVASYF